MEPSAVFGVEAKDVDAVWSEARPYLQLALSYDDGRYDLNDIYGRVKDETMQLWVAYDRFMLHAAAVTEIVNYPNVKVLRCAYAGGEHIEGALWFDDVLEDGAKQKNCSCVEIIGRQGWQKILRGYKRKGVILRKYL